MATLSPVDSQPHSSLQNQAIEKARSSFSRMPNDNALFQRCINQAESIPDVIKSVISASSSYKKRKSTRLLQKFEQHTQFLQNASDIVDIVVQTQAGIGCPIWAPIKFVLKISKDHAQAAEQVLNLIEVISENHPRFEIYGKLPADPILQIALLNIFTDVVEFSVRAIRYFTRNALARTTRLLVRSFKEEFGDIFDRLKRRTEVVDLTAMATQLLHAAESRQEAQRFRCQRWLDPPNVRDFHQHQAQSKLPGTCDWIRNNPAFLKWNEPSSTSISDRFLCISGTHGCGKTILASSIIEHLKSAQLQTIFFYLSGNNYSLKNLDGIVRAFLWQLLEDATDERSLGLISSLMLRGPPAVTDLIHVLKNMAALLTSPVYCVIDGVDEYIDERNDSIQDLLQLVHGLLNANSNFRVVLLGRQHVLQPHVLHVAIGATSERIDISSDLVKQDISTFIDLEIDAKIQSDLLSLPGLRDSISKTLKEKSDGMFLWVELMIKDLSKSDSPFEVKERLRNPPRNLEGIYRRLFLRLLQRLDKVQLNLARKILAFTIVSCRTLKVSELQYAHALDSGSSAFKEHLLLHPNQSILDVCGDFINIQDDLVQLIHFSVQEFLTRPEGEWHCNDDREIMCFQVDLEPSHRSLGSACVDYLGMCEYGYPLSDTGAFLKLAKDYPFIRYASRFAISHLNQSGPLCSSIAGKIRAFLGSEKYAFWLEYLVMLVLEDGSIYMLGEELEIFVSRLDMGEYKRKAFENDLRIHLHQELERRIRVFGERDSRTEQWQSLLYIIQDAPPKENGDEDSDHMLSTRTTWLPSTEEPSLSYITNALVHNQTLPLQRQIDILLRLGSHLQRVKVLTDPLKVLFRLILQKSHSIPIYILLAVAYFYFSMDKLEEALEVYRAALKKIETQETLMKFLILSTIGMILSEQKNYEEAVAMYRRSVEGRERLLGKENKDTLRDASSLAYILNMLGKYAEAESMLRRTLGGMENVFGKEHPDTLHCVNNLGVALGGQKQYEASEKIHRRVLEIRQRVSAKDDPDTLTTINNIGSALHDQGEYAAAEEMYRRALDGRQTVLGIEHPETLWSMGGLALLLHAQGEYKEAKEMHQRVLEGIYTILGKEHPDAVQSAKNLEAVLGADAGYGEVWEMYRQAREVLKGV